MKEGIDDKTGWLIVLLIVGLLLCTQQPQHPQKVADLIIAQFGAYAGQAIQIANCESSMNPQAQNARPVGDSYAEGLFQILVPSTWRTTSYAAGDPLDASTNTAAAWEIFKRDGYSWHEWACSKIVGLS